MKKIEQFLLKTQEDFINHVKNNPVVPDDKKEKIIQHEKAHYDKARELGYSPNYFYLRFSHWAPHLHF